MFARPSTIGNHQGVAGHPLIPGIFIPPADVIFLMSYVIMSCLHMLKEHGGHARVTTADRMGFHVAGGKVRSCDKLLSNEIPSFG